MSPRRVLVGACGLILATALAGCGEVKNTINARPGTAYRVVVALPSQPNANYVGIYDAQALGYFKAADLDVSYTVAPVGSDPSTTLSELWGRHAFVALSSEPAVLLARNQGEAVVSVAAIYQDPLAVTQRVKTRSGKKAPTKLVTVPDDSLLPTELQSRTGLPTYQGLVIAVRKGSIVNYTSPVRLFVQAVARGYRAARADPSAAVRNMIELNPSLAKQRAVILAGVRAALPGFFPPVTKHVWGWQDSSQWNAFGTWLSRQHLLTNALATPDASTNELLAGQGV